jgi:hypothetical protein
MRFFNLFLLLVLFLVPMKVASSGEKMDPQHPLPTPVMRAVTPETVKAGDVATVSGDYLDQTRVAEVYLTDGKTDLKVDILEQNATSLKFKVPAKAAPGRYNLMVLVVSEEPKLIEEPARLTVE